MEENTDAEKFFTVVKLCAAQSSNRENWLAIVRRTFGRYFDALPADKLADVAKDLPPAEIFDAIKDKPTFIQKLPAIVEGTAQSQSFNGWAKIILANDFPPEMILSRWNELNDDNKRAAFVKYFDNLPADKLADVAKDLPPAESFDAIKDKPTFIQKLPAIVEGAAQSQSFNGWAKIILANDFPSEMILSRWNELNDDNKRAAFVKYFDTLPADKLADVAKDLPPAEIFDAIKDKPTFIQKLPAIVEGTAQSQSFNGWAKIILANDFPPEMILSRWNELNDDNKRTAFVKYFDTLPADKLADVAKDLPPAEILNAVKDKPTFIQKLPAIVEGTAQSQSFNGWAKIILANDFPPEMILSRWNELNDDNKRVAFAKYFDTLPVDKLADVAKDLPPAEIFDAIKDKPTFIQKLPAIIERSNKKFSWAQCLLNNVVVFNQINVDADVMIFFMYEAVKRMNDLNALNKLIKLLKEKIDAAEASPRVKIIYSYICAAFSEHYALQRANAGDTVNRDEYFGKRDEFIADAAKAFTEIFNGLTKKIEAQAYNPDENFFYPERCRERLAALHRFPFPNVLFLRGGHVEKQRYQLLSKT